jgi:hypothetical protein
MKTVDVLIAAKSRIVPEENWTKGVLYGRKTPSGKRRAVEKLEDANCFCAIGAVGAACDVQLSSRITDAGDVVLEFDARDLTKSQQRSFTRATRYLNAAASQLAGRIKNLKWDSYSVANAKAFAVNDAKQVKHETVLELFDLAIRNAARRHINGGK